MKRLALALFRLLPFCGQYHLCNRKDFSEAAVELLITTIFSSMPLWILPLIGPLILKTNVSYREHLFALVGGGELLVYCAALAGPLIYIITRRYGEGLGLGGSSGTSRIANKFGLAIAFPHGTAFVFFSAMICIVAGITFSLMKNPGISNDVTKLNLDGIFWTSIALYLFSLYCFFWASAYRNAMAPFLTAGDSGDDRGQYGTRDEDDFSKQWQAHNAG